MKKEYFLVKHFKLILCLFSLSIWSTSCQKPAFNEKEVPLNELDAENGGDGIDPAHDPNNPGNGCRTPGDENSHNPNDPNNSNDPDDPNNPDGHEDDCIDPDDPGGDDDEPFNLKLTFDQTFPAGAISDGGVSFEPDTNTSIQELSLIKLGPQEVSLVQTPRPRLNETFYQGHDGTPYNEAFKIQEGKVLDVLIVLDDSTSMLEKHLKVANRLSELTSHLQGINWQIAVNSSTSSCLQQNRILKSTDPDVATEFKALVEGVGADGFDVEMGIKHAVKGLKGECNNTAPLKWVRDNSAVAVLIVADEDNCGKYESAFSPAVTDAWNKCLVDPEGGDSSYIVNYLNSIRPVANSARVYGIYWDPSNTLCDAGGSFGQKADRYSKAVKDTNGIAGCVYDSSYSNIMSSISNNVSQIVHTQFALKAIPDLGTLVVKIDGVAVAASDYELNGKILTIKNFAAGAQDLAVSYSSGAVPKTSVFPLAKKPFDGSLSVTMKVSGQIADPGTYTIQTNPIALSFDAIPPDYAEIKTSYIEDVPLQTEFSLGGIQIDGDPLAVTINGIDTTDYQYNAALKKIIFPAPPPENAVIVVTYKPINETVTEYAALPNANDAEKISAKDKLTNVAVDITFSGNNIVFNKADVVNGRKVLVTYEFGVEHHYVYLLPVRPIADTVKVVVADGSTDLGSCEDIYVIGKVVSFNCPTNQLPKIHINYQYIAAEYRQFTIEIADPKIKEKLTPKIMAKAEWRVFVDDNEIKDFSVKDFTVILNNDVSLDLNATVKVFLTVWLP